MTILVLTDELLRFGLGSCFLCGFYVIVFYYYYYMNVTKVTQTKKKKDRRELQWRYYRGTRGTTPGDTIQGVTPE